MKTCPFTPENPLRLAMWSGPRNISTALMRSWGNRDDSFVCDEPLYAHYLVQTRRPHPMAEEVIASQEQDWHKVVAWLTGPVPRGKTVFYQKHMSHHLLPQVGRDWLLRVSNAFLIRHPREVLPSFDEKFERETLLPDTGYPQQVEIFEYIRRQTGTVCPVVDAADLLANPRAVLIKLCVALGIPFQEAMLCWARGRRDTDGVWARHWYNSVETTTCFEQRAPKNNPLPDRLRNLYEQCLPYYETLAVHRITSLPGNS